MNVKRPWQINAITVLGFLFISYFLSHEAFKLFGIRDITSKLKSASVIRLIVFTITIFIIVRFYKLEKWAGYTIAGLVSLHGVSLVYTLINMLRAGKSIPGPLIIYLLIPAIICGIILWYLIRPELWKELEKVKRDIEKIKKYRDTEKQLLK